MTETLIKVEGISKKFCKDLKLGLYYGFKDLGANIFGSNKEKELRKKEFWAVDDISFEVKRGECLGLLGHNGAGKSTLLKVLTGLIAPDKGRIEMHGRVNALIELTAGFNPILTGRENIYANAAVLGLSDKEIKEKYDEIVAFSELEEFIDTPVQYYSSGMKVRLGFSVAVHTEPDVLILDEVLAVGDAGFKAKSFNKMKEIMQTAAVIFVSHSMPQVARICSDVLFMRHGKSFYHGNNISHGIEMYFDEFQDGAAKIESTVGATIDKFSVNGINYPTYEKGDIARVNYGSDLTLEFEVNITDMTVKEYYIIIQFIDKDLKPVAIHHTNKFTEKFLVKDSNLIKLVFPNIQLVDGEYSISYTVAVDGEAHVKDYKFLCTYRNYTSFKIMGLNVKFHASFYLDGAVFQNDNLLKSKINTP